ncbi:gluconate 2-dehydrogenase subunit 3 family protein [Sphingomonas tabacisoli]|uniref:Gluconate 2-dehydrogenase subunit 3 family protein n=1 Tax=Sphingomonas tabacisoli TaxID=2249466 RepID=A0ABW4I503_9SPHN
MGERAGQRWNRRDFFAGAALLALVVGVPAAAVRLSDLPDDEAPTDRQRALMREVSQLVLPRTGTAGAGDVGVGDFVVLALVHGLEGSRTSAAGAATPQFVRFRRPDGSLRQLSWLEDELDRRSRGDFLARPIAVRSEVLAKLDAEAFAKDVRDHPWKTVKGLILTGYYTSETGGSKELRYELVPGRWDPDLPLHPGDRAFSSDWTAVDFG